MSSNRKLAIIHTTPVTVDPLKELAMERMPGIQVINWVDDSILPQLAENGGQIEEVQERWSQYARFAEQLGADCILNACSSIGELVERVQPEIGIPIVRIDQAMAEYAVSSAVHIGVAATLATTLKPTERLLGGVADRVGKKVRLYPIVAESAYQKLLSGDKEGHDEELASSLRELAGQTEIVVLAQASMARVLQRFSSEEQKRFLTSPVMGIEKVKQVLENK